MLHGFLLAWISDRSGSHAVKRVHLSPAPHFSDFLIIIMKRMHLSLSLSCRRTPSCSSRFKVQRPLSPRRAPPRRSTLGATHTRAGVSSGTAPLTRPCLGAIRPPRWTPRRGSCMGRRAAPRASAPRRAAATAPFSSTTTLRRARTSEAARARRGARRARVLMLIKRRLLAVHVTHTALHGAILHVRHMPPLYARPPSLRPNPRPVGRQPKPWASPMRPT